MDSVRYGLLQLLIVGYVLTKDQPTTVLKQLVRPDNPAVNDRSIVYYITSPRIIEPNSQQPISVTILSPAAVDITLTIKQKWLNTTELATISRRIESLTTQRFNLTVADLPDGASIFLEAKGADDQGHTFAEIYAYEVRKTVNLIVIQTDKPLYQVGDTIKYRVLAVDMNLKPVLMPMDVKIMDPESNIIHEELQVNSRNVTEGSNATVGYHEGQLQIGAEVPLGSWTIEVNGSIAKIQSIRFPVQENVLPRFDLRMKGPKYIVVTEESIEITLTASYAFGKPVKGKAVIVVEGPPKWNWDKAIDSMSDARETRRTKTFSININGAAKVKVPLSAVTIKDDFNEWKQISMRANVTEDTTNATRTADGISAILTQRPFKIDIIKNVNTFRPGNVYNLLIVIRQHDGRPIVPSTNKLRINVTQSTSPWGDGFSEELMNEEFVVPENGQYATPVTPGREARSIHVTASMGEVTTNEMIGGLPSPSNSFIDIMPAFQDVSYMDTASFSISLTQPFDKLNYTVFSKGKLIAEGAFDMGNTTTMFSLQLNHNYTPRSRLLVYYIRPDTEVVANVIDFPVSGYLRNNITLTVTPSSGDYAEPGDEVNIKVETAPHSTVGLLAMDQSLALLAKDLSMLGPQIIKSAATSFDIGARNYDNAYGSSRLRFPDGGSAFIFLDQAGLIILTNAAIPGNPKYEDADNTTREVPRNAFTDGDLVTPVTGSFGEDILYASKQIGGFRIPVSPNVLKNYHHTFLFETLKSENGSVEISRKIPDTMTSWVCSAISLNNELGLGVTDGAALLKVFRPFFVVLNLPFSIIRGETIILQASVYNYLDSDQNANVYMEINGRDVNGRKWKIAPKPKTMIVKSLKSGVATFRVKPTMIGYMNVKVTAASGIAGDTVVRRTKVIPEGIRQTFSAPVYIDLRKDSSSSNVVAIPLPKDHVVGSEKLFISVTGDLLGSSIGGIDSFRNSSYGNGEASVAQLASNTHIMQYLHSTNKLDDVIRAKVLRSIRSSYQRQIIFKHYDQSYSPYGIADDSGSIYLTAMVVRTFVAASSFVPVDKSLITGAVNWMRKKQSKDGSFREVGKNVDRNLQGVPLTAYVLLTLLDAKEFGNYTENVRRATKYLEGKTRNIVDDVYALSLVNYVLQLAGSSAAESTGKQLESKAIVEGAKKHWAEKEGTDIDSFGEYKGPAKDVEMTAYNLLAAIRRNDVEGGYPVLSWLLAKRDDQGSFESPQATMAGLEAISQFGFLTGSKDRDLTVHITAGDYKKDFAVKEDNAQVVQLGEPKKFSSDVEIETSGHGTALVQVSWIYYMKKTSEGNGFSITTKVTKDKIDLVLQFCTKYQGQSGNTTAVMEVNIPTGYQADEEKVKKLVGTIQDLSRADVENDQTRLTFYFKNLSKTNRCVTFPAVRKFAIENPQDSTVVVYNYYDRSEKRTAFFSPK